MSPTTVRRCLGLASCWCSMNDSLGAKEALAQHRANCDVCRVGGSNWAKCSVGRQLTMTWLRVKPKEHRARIRRLRYWPRKARDKFKKWLFKRQRWTEEPIDGTERVYFEPSRWEYVKEWSGVTAQVLFALLFFFAVPRILYALYVGFRVFLRVLFR